MSPIKLFNIICGTACLVFGLVYVIQTNMLTTQTLSMRDAQNRFAMISEQRNVLVAQQAQMNDRTILEKLAQSQGLVSSDAVVYLVQDSSVAALH